MIYICYLGHFFPKWYRGRIGLHDAKWYHMSFIWSLCGFGKKWPIFREETTPFPAFLAQASTTVWLAGLFGIAQTLLAEYGCQISVSETMVLTHTEHSTVYPGTFTLVVTLWGLQKLCQPYFCVGMIVYSWTVSASTQCWQHPIALPYIGYRLTCGYSLHS